MSTMYNVTFLSVVNEAQTQIREILSCLDAGLFGKAKQLKNDVTDLSFSSNTCGAASMTKYSGKHWT